MGAVRLLLEISFSARDAHWARPALEVKPILSGVKRFLPLRGGLQHISCDLSSRCRRSRSVGNLMSWLKSFHFFSLLILEIYGLDLD